MGDEDNDHKRRIQELASKPFGYDTGDPYGNVDLADLPQWWREMVEEFRQYNMRPFRPSRFEDGMLTHTITDQLEKEFDVEIMFKKFTDSGEWTVLVDWDPIREIGHHRSPEGFSVFEMESDSFNELIRTYMNNIPETKE